MIASIVGCIVSIAYLVATTELDLDTSLHYRTKYPTVHGYIGKGAVREGSVVLGIVLFVSGILGAKLVALVMLGSGSMAVAVAWCAGEAAALFALRCVSEMTWRHHLLGLSGVVGSVIMHVAVYLGMLAAPFPFMRYGSTAFPHHTSTKSFGLRY